MEQDNSAFRTLLNPWKQSLQIDINVTLIKDGLTFVSRNTRITFSGIAADSRNPF